jgi:molybdopterin converting factor small subunit
MATFLIWGNLSHFTGGVKEVLLDVANVKLAFDELAEMFPGLAPELDENISVSVDGELYANALFIKIKPDSEVVLLPRLKGG